MNTANKLTILRILVVPFFMFFLLTRQIAPAIAAFAFASLTDGLDGYVARKYNQITNFGKFIDPLADKLLVISALVCFNGMLIVPSWAIFIIIARELMVTALRTLAVQEGVVVAASIWGKAKTVSQIVAIIAIMLDMMVPLSIGNFNTTMYLFGLATVLTLISGIDYFAKSFHMMKFK